MLAGNFLFGTLGLNGVALTTFNATIGAITGGIMGGVNAALAGGDLGDVLRGAAVGAVQGAISSGPLHSMEASAQGLSMGTLKHVVGHGVVGGAANAAMGGKFQDGFVSAASSAFAGDMGWNEGATRISRTIKAGIIGGTVSALGGGKFANGAYTSAFQHLLNREFTHTYEGLAPFDPNDPKYTFQCDSACHGIDETGRFYDIQNGVTTFTYNSWNFSSSGGMQDASVPIIEYIVAGGVGRAILGLLSKTAVRATWSVANARAAGVAGESAVGIAQAGKTTIQVAGRRYVPDLLTRSTLEEVKNTSTLSFTRQLRAFSIHAQNNQLTYVLWTRSTTIMTAPLKAAIARGEIIPKIIPGF
jgi:hypothetical protein